MFVSAAVLYAVTNFTKNGKFVLMNWCYPFCLAVHNSLVNFLLLYVHVHDKILLILIHLL